MIDIDGLRKAIRVFEIDSMPHSWSASNPASIGDINKLRDSIKAVLSAFVDELERK